MSLMAGITSGNIVQSCRIDEKTASLQVIDYPHHEIHGGSGYFMMYSVADLGAMTTPNDTISLTFTTPASPYCHMIFEFIANAGALCTVREGGSGGANPTGSFTIYNRNRNSSNTSGILDIAGSPAAGKMSYDATLDSNGVAFQFYLPGTSGNPAKGSTAESMDSRGELILKASTRYQVSIVDTANVPATILLDWYEHTDLSAAAQQLNDGQANP